MIKEKNIEELVRSWVEPFEEYSDFSEKETSAKIAEIVQGLLRQGPAFLEAWAKVLDPKHLMEIKNKLDTDIKYLSHWDKLSRKPVTEEIGELPYPTETLQHVLKKEKKKDEGIKTICEIADIQYNPDLITRFEEFLEYGNLDKEQMEFPPNCVDELEELFDKFSDLNKDWLEKRIYGLAGLSLRTKTFKSLQEIAEELQTKFKSLPDDLDDVDSEHFEVERRSKEKLMKKIRLYEDLSKEVMKEYGQIFDSIIRELNLPLDDEFIANEESMLETLIESGRLDLNESHMKEINVNMFRARFLYQVCLKELEKSKQKFAKIFNSLRSILQTEPAFKENTDGHIVKLLENLDMIKEWQLEIAPINYKEIRFYLIEMDIIDHMKGLLKASQELRRFIEKFTYQKNLSCELIKTYNVDPAFEYHLLYFIQKMDKLDSKSPPISENFLKDKQKTEQLNKAILKKSIDPKDVTAMASENLRQRLTVELNEKIKETVPYIEPGELPLLDMVKKLLDSNLFEFKDFERFFRRDDYNKFLMWVQQHSGYAEYKRIQEYIMNKKSYFDYEFIIKDFVDVGGAKLRNLLLKDKRLSIQQVQVLEEKFSKNGISALLAHKDLFPRIVLENKLREIIFDDELSEKAQTNHVTDSDEYFERINVLKVEKILNDAFNKVADQKLPNTQDLAQLMYSNGWKELAKFDKSFKLLNLVLKELLENNTLKQIISIKNNTDSNENEYYSLYLLVCCREASLPDNIIKSTIESILDRGCIRLGEKMKKKVTDIQKAVAKKKDLLILLLKKGLKSEGVEKISQKLLEEVIENGFNKEILKDMDEKTKYGLMKNDFLLAFHNKDISILNYIEKALQKELAQYVQPEAIPAIAEEIFRKTSIECLLRIDEIIDKTSLFNNLKREWHFPELYFTVKESGSIPAEFPKIFESLFNLFERNEKLNLQKFNEVESFLKSQSSKSFEMLLEEIFKEEPSKFKDRIFEFLFFLIKRNQSLPYYSNVIQIIHKNESDLADINMKTLIHLLYISSDYELREKIISCLNLSSPIPVTIPTLTQTGKIDIQYVPEAFWTFDENKSYFMSFGIGDLKGKTSLLNLTFGTSFERSRESPFYLYSIDMQSDKTFKNPPRDIMVFDTHRSIYLKALRQLGTLMNGYLIHIAEAEINDFKGFLEECLQILDSHPPQTQKKFVILLIRDCKGELLQEEELLLKYKLQIDAYQSLQIKTICVPNLKDFTTREIFAQKIRDEIFNKKLEKNSRKILKTYLEVLPKEEMKRIQEISNSMESLANDLLEFMEKNDNAYQYLPLYSVFHRMFLNENERRRLEKVKGNNTQAQKLAQEGNKLREQLLENCSNKSFCQKFFHLLESQDSIIQMNAFVRLLKSKITEVSNKIKRQREILNEEYYRLRNNEDDENRKHQIREQRKLLLNLLDTKNFSIELFWRDLILFQTHVPSDVQSIKIIKKFQYFVDKGFPFEIFDGDNFHFPHFFLDTAFKDFKKGKVFVISIVGPQNSGKSTLLNYLFGCNFNVSDGRCTRGIYGTLVPSVIEGYDQMLILDTEGLQSVEKANIDSDLKLLLFCLALSEVVIINVKDEMNSDMKKLLETCVDVLKILNIKKVPNPDIYFVFNQKLDPNLENQTGALSKIQSALIPDDMGSVVNLSLGSYDLLPSAYNVQLLEMNAGTNKWRQYTTNEDFTLRVNRLNNKLQNCGEKRCKNVPFCNMCEWLDMFEKIVKLILESEELTTVIDEFARKTDEDCKNTINGRIDLDVESDDFKGKIEDSNEEIKSLFQNKKEEYKLWFQKYCREQKIATRIMKSNLEYLTSILNHRMDLALQSQKLKIHPRLISSAESQLSEKINIEIEKIITTGNKLDEGKSEEIFNALFDEGVKNARNKINNQAIDKELLNRICTHFKIYCRIPSRAQMEKMIRLEEDELKKNSFFENKDTSYLKKQNFESIKFEIFNQEILRKDFDLLQKKLNKIAENYTGDFNSLRKDYGIDFLPDNSVKKITPYAIKIVDMQKVMGEQSSKSLGKAISEFWNGKYVPQDFTVPFLMYLNEQFNKDNYSGYLEPKKPYDLIQELIKDRLQGNQGSREVNEELVQNLSSYISEAVIARLNQETGVFGLSLKKDVTQSFYHLALKLVFQAQSRSEAEKLDRLIAKLENSKQEKKEYFVKMVLQDDQVQGSSQFFSKLIQNILSNLAERNAKQVFDQEMRKIGDQISRLSLQKDIDSIITKKDEQYQIDYIEKPTESIIKLFDSKWEKTKTIIGEKFKEVHELAKQFRAHLVDSLTNLRVAITSINFNGNPRDLLESTQNDVSDIKLGKACANLLFNYLTKKNYNAFTLDEQTFTLKIAFPQAPEVVLEDMEVKDLTYFESEFMNIYIPNLLEFLNIIISSISNLNVPSYGVDDINVLDSKDVYRTFKERAEGCHAKCPCCARLCDAEHYKKVGIAVGEESNKHSCQTGHQLRAFNGYKMEKTEEAVIRICEEVQDNDWIIFKGERMRWTEFRNRNDTWDLQTKHISEIRMKELRTKFLEVWRKTGQYFCQKYVMKYCEANQRQRESALLHFIFMLDCSGSMSGSPWHALMDSLGTFIDIRVEEQADDVMSVITFNDNAETVFSDKGPSKELTKQIRFRSGGTNFSAPLEKAYSLITSLGSSNRKFILVFMTDGGASYPDKQIKLLQSKRPHIEAFWAIAFGSGGITQDLAKIVENMGGTLKKTLDCAELKEAFAEIANTS